MTREPLTPHQAEYAAKTRAGIVIARWAARSTADANRRAIVWTGITMLLMVMASRRDPAQAAFIRNISMIMIGMHGVCHVALVGGLNWLRDKGVSEASLALDAYFAPRRITNLDLAMSWALLLGAVSLFRVVYPVVAAG